MADRPAPRDIRFSYSTIDHFSESRRFKTLDGAKAYVARRIGKPSDGYDRSFAFGYLIDAFGVGKLTVTGATWDELGYGG